MAAEPSAKPAETPAKAPPKRRRKRAKLAALGISLGVAAICVEVAARIFLKEDPKIAGKPLGPNAFYESLRYPMPSDPPQPPYALDKQVGFCLVPSYESIEPFPEAPSGKYVQRTNALGLRDERSADELRTKKPGTLRVLAVGDSMTFGIGVEREEAYSAVLEKSLAAKLGKPVEVVNAGVCCWGQREEIAFLEKRAPELKPDVVILEFTVANDVLDNLRYERSDGDLLPDPNLGKDLEQHWMFELPLLASSSRAYRLLAWNVGRHVARYRAMMEPWRLEFTAELVRRGRAAAEKLGARFVLLIAPTNVQVDRSAVEAILRTHRINEAVIDAAKGDGVVTIDPLDRLREERAKGNRPYFPRDMHWNVTGHKVVGEALAEALAK